MRTFGTRRGSGGRGCTASRPTPTSPAARSVSRPFLLPPAAAAPAASVGRLCTQPHATCLLLATVLWVHVAESCCCQGGERRRCTAKTRPTPRRWLAATCAACSSAAGRQQEPPSRSCSWPAPSPSTGWCAHADLVSLCALRLLRHSALILWPGACRFTTSRTVRARLDIIFLRICTWLTPEHHGTNSLDDRPLRSECSNGRLGGRGYWRL